MPASSITSFVLFFAKQITSGRISVPTNYHLKFHVRLVDPVGSETLSDQWGNIVLPVPRTNRALLPNGSRWRDAGKTQLHTLTPGGGALRCWGWGVGEEAFPPDVEIRDLEGSHCFKMYLEDFPGGPVAKTPRSQCRGPRFHPWSGN